ncbi:glutathione S-transferase [Rhizobium sp. BK376]|uniref:glutathione S-transferase family protein n=1 Tax=Rhizobium sp. BK376 TaxID=2512149 RepID=UPI00104A6315|nr:glutathione S-transferase [Rhizobium sp. BK376]TCR75640.1 glutathione S-transferase [Rhizobium sp. BK376]
MKIYDRPGFPNPARIRIVLSGKGLDKKVEFVPVDLIAAEHKQKPFLNKNPSGVIPVLELDDGTLISEATAITEYLDNLDGDPMFTGKTPLEKGLIHMMQRRAESMLIDPVGLYFHYGTPGLGEALQAHKSPEWEGRSEWARRNRQTAEQGMRYFDGILEDQNFVAVDYFSMADITVFSGLAFAEAAGLTVGEDLSNLRAWRLRASELPSVKNRTGQQFVADDLRRLGF